MHMAIHEAWLFVFIEMVNIGILNIGILNIGILKRIWVIP